MGPGGMCTRWLHTWYFTLQQGGSSHSLHNSPTPLKTCSGCVLAGRRRSGDACESAPSQSQSRLLIDSGSFLHGHTRGWRRSESTPAIFPFSRFIGYCSDIKVPSLPLRLTIACVIGTMWPQVLGYKGANGTRLPMYRVLHTRQWKQSHIRLAKGKEPHT